MRLVLAVLFVVAATGLAGAQGNPNKSDEVLRQRILLKERFNKGWDVTVENSKIGSSPGARRKPGGTTR